MLEKLFQGIFKKAKMRFVFCFLLSNNTNFYKMYTSAVISTENLSQSSVAF